MIRSVRRVRGQNIPLNPAGFHFDWSKLLIGKKLVLLIKFTAESYNPLIQPGFYRDDVIVQTPCTYARHMIHQRINNWIFSAQLNAKNVPRNVENTWISSTVCPPHKKNCSMYNQMRRTNNNVEEFQPHNKTANP